MTRCDFGTDCEAPATAVLWFRDQPGHVHVCAVHERIDREHADVTSSAVMVLSVCPVCSRFSEPLPIRVELPRLLEG